MAEIAPSRAPKAFHVRFGLSECTVSCTCRKEALERARDQLGQRMPQMWDVIQGIDDSKFQVREIS